MILCWGFTAKSTRKNVADPDGVVPTHADHQLDMRQTEPLMPAF